MFTYDAEKIEFGPVNYIDFMKSINDHCRPRSYFEIGTETGRSAAAFTCETICVDPDFKIDYNVFAHKSAAHFYQMTSDIFFSTIDLKNILKNGPDICFLDGMHRFEYLLRDFINIEKLCHQRSTIMIHDCLPLNRRMALRQHIVGDEDEDAATRQAWTGDVWKILPILKKFRPDLSIVIADASPSGLVLINKLNPSSTILSDNYYDAVEEFRSIQLLEYGIENLWNLNKLANVKLLSESPDELTTFFGLY